MPVLVDTGVLYALADRDDNWHERAVEYLDGTDEMLLVPVTVIPEVTCLLKARLGDRAERQFVAALAAGELGVEPLTAADLKRCDEVLNRYPALGFVDASVVAMAERLGVKTLATTDRRHFGQVSPRHVPRFDLVPSPDERWQAASARGRQQRAANDATVTTKRPSGHETRRA